MEQPDVAKTLSSLILKCNCVSSDNAVRQTISNRYNSVGKVIFIKSYSDSVAAIAWDCYL